MTDDIARATTPSAPALSMAVLHRFSEGIRRFCHDANNSLTAATAATSLALLEVSDQRQRSRLERVNRQLSQLHSTIRQLQSIAIREPIQGDTETAVWSDAQSQAERLKVSLETCNQSETFAFIRALGEARARYFFAILTSVAAPTVKHQHGRGRVTLTTKVGGQSTWSIDYNSATTNPAEDDGSRKPLPVGHLGCTVSAITALAQDAGGDCRWHETIGGVDCIVTLPVDSRQTSP